MNAHQFGWTYVPPYGVFAASKMHAFLQTGGISPPEAKRRVLIVDDHNFFAACLRTLLDQESDLVVCDIMTNSTELRERIERLAPDLLVIDLTLGTESGLEVGQRLRDLGIATPILFVSSLRGLAAEELASIRRAAFMRKGSRPEQFLAALRAMLASSESGPADASSPFAPAVARI